jgi:DNA polymerase (family X)
LWAAADAEATKLETVLKGKPFHRVGALRRLVPVVEALAFLTTLSPDECIVLLEKNKYRIIEKADNTLKVKSEDDVPILIYTCEAAEFGSKLFRYTGSRIFLDAFVSATEGVDFKGLATEEAVFEKAALPFIAPELRDDAANIDWAKSRNTMPSLISLSDIKGVIHTHTTYSDGANTLEEMAAYAQELGYQYIGITDHSKAAFYANGMKEDRVMAQWAAIDELNAHVFNFKILKGIECDILNDGSMDYSDEILRGFDFVIASIHSQLKMTLEKATQRLIKAIENPFVTMLGHPTGRLLLSREGYPIDHQKVIDACAANKVAIELNANPYRLDLDWTWIPYALEKGVMISVNPDAHSRNGIHDTLYGIFAARKGRLTSAHCLNALDVEDFLAFSKK